MKLVCKLIKTKQFSKLSCKRFILDRLVKDSICFLAPSFHFLSIHVKKTLISVTFVSLLIFLFPNNDYVGFFGTAFWLSWFTWVAIFFSFHHLSRSLWNDVSVSFIFVQWLYNCASGFLSVPTHYGKSHPYFWLMWKLVVLYSVKWTNTTSNPNFC